MSETRSVRRVAKNSVYMYIRLIVLMCINFYTSRLLLFLLGVDDYGVLSVVGSIATSFVALKSFFSESIQRFLNVAKGKKGESVNEQIAIFNLSLYIHFLLILIFVAIVEIVGLWLLNNKLSIPENRVDTAFFVFQMSTIAISIGILSIPYDALIIANEDMGLYAIVSIIDGLLKLAFILVLPLIGGDFLKEYSVFLVFIPLSTLAIQILYCRKYRECLYRFIFDKKLFKNIVGLSGWNFFGNISFSLIHEGINMLLNMFGGVRLNASRAIAYQIKTMTLQVASNSMVAVRPLVMQQSAKKSVEEHVKDICSISRLSFFLNLVPIVPLFVYCPQLIKIWLVEIPDNVILFTRLILIGILIRSLHEPINIMHMSLGNIRRMMIIEAIIMILFFFLIYYFLFEIGHVWIPFFLLVLMEIIIITGLIINARYELGFPILYYMKQVLFPMLYLTCIIGLFSWLLYVLFDVSSLINLFIGIVILLISEFYFFYLIMNKRERNIINKIINK